jgi:hypothetical protein
MMTWQVFSYYNTRGVTNRFKKHYPRRQSDYATSLEKQVPATTSQAFVWRLVRLALAIAERAGKYSAHINQQCAYYGLIENDFHLFFHCDLPRAVWLTANPPLAIDSIPNEDDGIQLTLPRQITSTPIDEILCKTIFTMWYIWKARNDNKF